MHLTPREHERLLLAAAADLARRRLGRGARLGVTEAVALVCDEICEMAWDGVSHDEVVARARHLVDPASLLDGAAAAVPSLQVEALFPHGTALVHVDAPFGAPGVDDAGAVRVGDGEVVLAPGRERAEATLHNTGPLDVWVSSHVPLDALNPALVVTTPPGRWRLDVPAGTALRITPDEQRPVAVVAIVR